MFRGHLPRRQGDIYVTTPDNEREQQRAGEPAADEQATVNGQTDGATDGEDLSAQLARVSAERDDFFDQLQRSRAEFINYRKRTDQERLKLAELFTAETLKQFLPVIDDFERAIEAVPASEKESGWVAGISLIYQKLLGILQRAGVQVVESLNQPFDPALHEAVATDPGSTGETVVEVYQKGYKLGDTLLRAAMVKTGDATPETVGSTTTTFDA